MELLFTQGTHHRRVSVVLLSQNIYPMGKHARTIALNTWYLILMKHLRDVSQFGTLARFVKAYEDALSEKYSYLVVEIGGFPAVIAG